MATIIDSLTVLLNLDPKNFTKGQREAAESLRDFRRASDETDKAGTKRAEAMDQGEQRRMRDRDKARAEDVRKAKDAAKAREKAETESAKRQRESYTLAKEAALGFGAAIASLGVEKLVQGVSQSVAQSGLLARNLDITTPALIAWGRAVERSVGGSAEAASGTLQKVTQDLIHMRMQFSGDNPLFVLGKQLENYSKSRRAFNFQGSDGKLITAQGFLKEVASYAPDVDPAVYATLLGDAGFDAGTTNYLAQGLPKVNADLAAQQKTGLPSDKAAADMLALANATEELKQTFDQLVTELVVDFGPTISKGLKNITAFIQLLDGKINLGEYLDQTNKNAHDAEVEYYVLAGKSRKDAERLATIDDANDTPWISFTSSTKPVAPPLSTEVQNTGFWGGLADMLGIHLYRRNAPTEGTSSQSNSASLPKLPPEIEAEVRRAAIKHGVDPDHMVRLFAAEGGGYNKVSSSGAFGPAQLLPGTAALMGVATSVNDPNYDWRKNVDAGVLYWLMQYLHFRKKAVADAAYHNGPADSAVLAFAQTGSLSRFGPHSLDYLAKIDGILPAGAGHMISDNTVTGVDTGRGSTTNHSSEVNINTVNVNGVNTNNVHSVAGGIQAAVRLGSLTAQSDKGLF